MNSWCTFICQMFKTLHLSEYYNNLILCDINVANDAINNLYNDCWKKEARQNPKLRFYNKFKTDPSTEYYIKMHLSPTERYHMSQLIFILPTADSWYRKPSPRLCPGLY